MLSRYPISVSSVICGFTKTNEEIISLQLLGRTSPCSRMVLTHPVAVSVPSWKKFRGRILLAFSSVDTEERALIRKLYQFQRLSEKTSACCLVLPGLCGCKQTDFFLLSHVFLNSGCDSGDFLDFMKIKTSSRNKLRRSRLSTSPFLSILRPNTLTFWNALLNWYLIITVGFTEGC